MEEGGAREVLGEVAVQLGSVKANGVNLLLPLHGDGNIVGSLKGLC